MISDFRGGKIFADGELLSNNGFLETIKIEPEPVDLDIYKGAKNRVDNLIAYAKENNIEAEYIFIKTYVVE